MGARNVWTWGCKLLMSKTFQRSALAKRATGRRHDCRRGTHSCAQECVRHNGFNTLTLSSRPRPGRPAFETFPCPILRLEFEREKVWQISAIKPAGLHTLTDQQEDSFAAALDKFSKKLWRKPRARKTYRYDIAMLADPNEAMPPSNKRALKSFITVKPAMYCPASCTPMLLPFLPMIAASSSS